MHQLYNPQPYYGTQQVAIGNGELLPINQTKQSIIITPNCKLLLQNSLHVSSISHNLIYIQKLADDNFCSIILYSHGFTIKDNKTNQVLLQGPLSQALYQTSSPSSCSLNSTFISSTTSSSLWHRPLGHPSHCIQAMLHLSKHTYLDTLFNKKKIVFSLDHYGCLLCINIQAL